MRYLTLLLALFLPLSLWAQPSDEGFKFSYPLDVNMSLSGNFGELRSNHFHAGIDFRIGGVSGAPVYAAADGYICRISVSPTGYGNALYIMHDNGYVTLYGHLQRFAEKIKSYLLSEQYKSEKANIDIALDSALFPVKRGELIAYGGNTGSSGGPHLHFEVRKEGKVVNPVTNKLFAIEDNRAPIFNRVAFMGYSKVGGVVKTFKIERPRGKSSPILLPPLSYVAIDAVDKMEGTNAKLAVSEYKVFLDGQKIYSFKVGDIPMNESRYINSLTELSLRGRSGAMIKSYVEPGNGLGYKTKSLNSGLIVLNDNALHTLKIEVEDYAHNSESVTYKIKRDDAKYAEQINDTLPQKGHYMAWYLPNYHKKEGFICAIPIGALYRSIYFMAEEDSLRYEGIHSKVWRISGYDATLHRAARLSVKYSGPDSLKEKALLVAVTPKGEIFGAGGGIDKNGYVTSYISSFGTYGVAIDTVPPVVRPNFANGARLNRDVIAFRISDRLSGLASYRVEIDGNWVVCFFDQKQNRLSVNLKDAKITPAQSHTLILRVLDSRGNETLVKRDFKW